MVGGRVAASWAGQAGQSTASSVGISGIVARGAAGGQAPQQLNAAALAGLHRGVAASEDLAGNSVGRAPGGAAGPWIVSQSVIAAAHARCASIEAVPTAPAAARTAIAIALPATRRVEAAHVRGDGRLAQHSVAASPRAAVNKV